MGLVTTPVINEGKSATFQVSFFNEDKVATIPSKAYIRIDDEESGTSIRARVELTGLASVMQIDITATENRIIDQNNKFEARKITLEWDYGVGKHGNDDFTYLVKNLIYIS